MFQIFGKDLWILHGEHYKKLKAALWAKKMQILQKVLGHIIDADGLHKGLRHVIDEKT